MKHLPHLLAASVVAGGLWLAHRNQSNKPIAVSGATAVAYPWALGRIRRAARREVLNLFLERPVIKQLLVSLVEKHLTGPKASQLQPELNAAVESLGALADKALQTYGPQLLAKIGIKA